MSSWNNAAKTAAGHALDQKLLNQEIYLKLTKAEAGAGRVNPTQIAVQTAVADVKQRLEMEDVIRNLAVNTTITLPVVLSNTGVTEGYTLQQIGVYAEDPDEGEILYFLAQSSDEAGEEIPTASDSKGFTFEWNFGINVSNAEKVEVTLSEAGRLTLDQADARYAKKTELEDLKTKVDNIDVSEQIAESLKNYYTKAETYSREETNQAIFAAIEENIIAVLEGSY